MSFFWVIREIATSTPLWFRIWMVICLVFGIALTVYTFQECGWKAMFLGNGAAYAAFTGMCE